MKHLGEIELTSLEIGALDCPTFLKSEGNVYFADYFSRSESVGRHTAAKNHDSSLIVDVDFILREKILSEAVTVTPNLIIANHVMEHLPNPIQWLLDLANIADNPTYLLLSLPDRQYTFDYFKPVSDAVDWIRSYDVAQEIPDKYQILRHLYYHADVTGPKAWNNDIPEDHMYRRTMPQAIIQSAELSKVYTDVHCSIFTCESFCRLISDVQHLIPWKIWHFEDVAPQENEFKILMRLAR